MDFRPVMNNVRQMDPRIFKEGPMGIRAEFMVRNLERRIQYDADKNVLHLDFSGLEVNSIEDCENIRDVAKARCVAAGRKVKAIVNYEAFMISEDLVDTYLEITQPVITTYYENVARFTSSADMQAKLTARFQQHKLAPSLFHTAEEAEHALLSL